MDKTALRLARERLDRAGAAHQRLLDAKQVGDAELAWSDFLMAASSVFEKLEKGSKGHGKTEPWFGQIKHARKKDDLLSYLHHARDADHHGIKEISKREIKGTKISGATGGGRLYGLKVTGGGEVIQHPMNTGIVVETVIHMVLADVHDDRFGYTFQVPTTHLESLCPTKTRARSRRWRFSTSTGCCAKPATFSRRSELGVSPPA